MPERDDIFKKFSYPQIQNQLLEEIPCGEKIYFTQPALRF